MQTYEYIFSAVIIVAVLLAGVLLVGITPQSTINTSEIDQLKMVAQKVMTQLVLSPGYPLDWGSNIKVKGTDLATIGLAYYSNFTSMAYSLDPDKAQRLHSNLKGHQLLRDLYVPPEKMLELLNLGREYGVKIEFIPSLNIKVTQTGGDAAVTVTSDQGQPLKGAKVTARLFSAGQLTGGATLRGETDASGICTLTGVSGGVLVVIVDYNGVQGVKVEALGISTNTAYFFGNYFIPSNQISGSVYQVFITRFINGSYAIGCVGCPLVNEVNGRYEMGFVEPNTVAVLGVTNRMEVAVKRIPESYSTASGDVYAPLSYMLERTVKIGFSMYTLRVYVWRTSW